VPAPAVPAGRPRCRYNFVRYLCRFMEGAVDPFAGLLLENR
jgi:hypothetical protein